MHKKKNKPITIYFDGACEPSNPEGIATYGFAVYDTNGLELAQGKGVFDEPFSKISTNNTAEYTGLIEGVKWVVENGYSDHPVIVKGDSQLAIRQLKGRYRVRSAKLIPLYRKVKGWIDQISNIRFQWIPREKNEVADRLSHEIYEDLLDEHPEYRAKIKGQEATEKQKAFMDRLKITYGKYIGKREASRLISRKLK
jgi:ribonuclease HI